MQFVNMDVDRLGSRERFQLGTFSAGLNAICGPRGSGKSRLVRWLRAMFAGGEATESSWHDGGDRVHGCVELRAGQNHFRLHGDGNRSISGGPTFELLARDGARDGRNHRNGDHCERPFSALQRQAISESLAIPSDSKAIERLAGLAKRLGLEPEITETVSRDRTHLLARELEILDELKRLDSLGANREALLARKLQLESELERVGRRRATPTPDDDSRQRQRQRLDEQVLLAESEIRSAGLQIEDLDRSLARCRAELESPSVNTLHGETYNRIAPSFRERMIQLDGQLQRWRQTLGELRAYRDRLNRDATDARLDQQIGDRLSPARRPAPRSALRALESQIVSARRQWDDLLGHYDRCRGEDAGETHVVIPEALRAMQKELYEVCQQLSLHESLSVRDSLIEQSAQLQRCESELLGAIEKLIAQRGEILQAIAEEYQAPREQIALAFGDGCQCTDHPHLTDWLAHDKSLTNSSPTSVDSATRQSLLDSIRSSEESRGKAGLKLADAQERLYQLQSQLRSSGDVRPEASTGRHQSDILGDLDRIALELRALEARDRWQAELDGIRRALDRPAPNSMEKTTFRRQVERHVTALSGTSYDDHGDFGYDLENRRALRSQSDRGSTPIPDLGLRLETAGPARYSEHDFTVPRSPHAQSNGHRTSSTPDAIVEAAMRLALAECLTERGQGIPVVLDSTLDDLHLSWRENAVRHFARIAEQGRQQIILLTGEQQLERIVRDYRGSIFALPLARPMARETFDVNRQLTAYANDHEAEKWSKPEPSEPIRVPVERRTERPRGRFFLTERSNVEQLESIDSESAARMRELGVDRIGELLDADPRWLVDGIRLPGVTESSVRTWQSEASLLCSAAQLRPFDARVLVGAGIRHPQQLAEMHPSRLLERVEKFLSTDRGREILRSGNSYELSRITSWIASAKSGAPQDRRSNFDAAAQSGHASSRTSSRNDVSPRKHRTGAIAPGFTTVDEEPSTPTDGPRLVRRSMKENSSRSEGRVRKSEDRGQRSNQRVDRVVAQRTDNGAQDSRGRFYLDLSSPAVDAPSIGPRMAERLTGHGIATVQQLLSANAETLASALAVKQVTAATVRSWQDQARLVCRIPNLRGHDAQLLVNSGINSPERLARMQPEVILQQVLAVARTAEGQRIIRGGKLPDLAEVTDWVTWANHSRSIQAA